MAKRKPNIMIVRVAQNKENTAIKNPPGRRGMQRTTAGSYEKGYRMFTNADIEKESIHERLTIIFTFCMERTG